MYDHVKLPGYDLKSINLEDGKTDVIWKIVNDGSTDLPATGWDIYFSQIAMAVDNATLPKQFNIENIKGDFQKLSPTQSFDGLAAGDSIVIEFSMNSLILRESFLPASPYIKYHNSGSYTIDKYFTSGLTEQNYKDFDVPSVEDRYVDNQTLQKLPEFNLVTVLPRPKTFIRNGQILHYNGRVNIIHDPEFEDEAVYLKGELQKLFTGTINLKKSQDAGINDGIFLMKLPDNSIEKEAYKLQVTESGVAIQASHKTGIFYGLQSLRQLVEPDNYRIQTDKLSISNARIDDSPRFAYRGLMLDVARNFHRKKTVLEILDLMSMYKLNKFHFHLTDDEGWRLEIDGIPELTNIASRRGHTLDEKQMTYPFYASGPHPEESYGSGYYTKADFIEILKYAHDRHIEVIPEIDLPGHMRAAIKAMTARYHKYISQGDEPEAAKYLLEDFDDQSEYSSAQGYDDNTMCVCQESAFTFIEKVVDELVKLYDEAGVPFNIFHSGGDEVPYGAWQKSPICKAFINNNKDVSSSDGLHAYVLNRFKTILAKYDLTSAGWEEILMKHSSAGHHGIEINPEFVGDDVMAYVWNAIWGSGREDMAYKLANMGYPIVMCNSSQLYLDMAYNTDPQEKGLSWSGYTNTKSAFDLVPFNIFQTAKPNDYAAFIKDKVMLTEKGKENILGIQGQLWSETLKSREALYYMMFPKFFSLAERAWSPAEDWETSSRAEVFTKQESDWNTFANILGQRELKRIDHLYEGIPYRIPLPGARVDNGMLKANVAFPGLTIRYTTDGSDPNENSTIYEKPIAVNAKIITLKTFSSTGRSSRSSIINNEFID